MIKNRVQASLLSVLLGTTVFSYAGVEHYRINFTGGTFFGPGRMPNVPMATGTMHVVELNKNLKGVTPYFNNGEAEPNISSRVPSLPKLEGMMSNQLPFNENMDGGVVDVGNGALKLLNVVTKDGPHNGTQTYALTKKCDWKITTDLALDPGFKHGILLTPNLVITSSLVDIPNSLQTENKMPSGADSAGSVPSGAKLIGRVGDYDFDGYLDGELAGKAIIPLDHIFYPGAPVAQSRVFESNIPIAHVDAAGLSLSGLRNYKNILKDAKKNRFPLVTQYYEEKYEAYFSDIQERVKATRKHLERVSKKSEKVYKLITKLSSLEAEIDAIDRVPSSQSYTQLLKSIKKSQKLVKILKRIMNIKCG